MAGKPRITDLVLTASSRKTNLIEINDLWCIKKGVMEGGENLSLWLSIICIYYTHYISICGMM